MTGKKYIVVEKRTDCTHTAWAKAPADVVAIAKGMGFEEFLGCAFEALHENDSRIVRVLRRIGFYLACSVNAFGVPRNSTFLVQHPLDWMFRGTGGVFLGIAFFRLLVRITGSKVVAIVHDLEDIRLWFGNHKANAMSDTRRLVKLADKIIVHNDTMKRWLVEHGVDGNRIEVLEIFDYLADGYEPQKEIPYIKALTIAGNLNQEKSSYLAKLKEVADVQWHLYGNRYDENKCGGSNITYHGVFPPEKLLSEMKYGFGLVWDGDSLEACSGNTGAYLKVNNPHKLSMYLAAGLPVVIWDQSARADFVRDNGLGLVVSSLRDIGRVFAEVSDGRYSELRCNVAKMSEKLRAGYFTRTAVEKSMKFMV